MSALKIIERGDSRGGPDDREPDIRRVARATFRISKISPAHYFDYGVDYDADGRANLIR